MSAAVTGLRPPEPPKVVLPSSYGVPNIPFEFDNHYSITKKGYLCLLQSFDNLYHVFKGAKKLW